MTTANVVFDFTKSGQPSPDVAIMPAALAKQLLQDFAASLLNVKAIAIMDWHLENLGVIKQQHDFDAFVKASQDFLDERTLINNIKNGNWDVYKVEPKP